MTKKRNVLLASAAAGLMTLALTAGAGTAHACAGKNECKGQGWVYKASADECLKIEGGRLTPEAK